MGVDNWDASLLFLDTLVAALTPNSLPDGNGTRGMGEQVFWVLNMCIRY